MTTRYLAKDTIDQDHWRFIRAELTQLAEDLLSQRERERAARAAWFTYLETHEIPADVPKRPDRVYKGKGWSGWADWLGMFSASQALKTFWVVNDPTPTSELGDILWEATPSKFFLVALGAGTRYRESGGIASVANTPADEHWTIYQTRDAALSDPRVIVLMAQDELTPAEKATLR